MTETRGHAHTIEIEPIEAHVRISVDGTAIADTNRAVVLREGSLPPRYYIPETDVDMSFLVATKHRSHCPFKGDASYWSVGELANVAWSYREPIAGAEPISRRIAFYNEKVDIEVDGKRLERPKTKWS